ncbi:MAG: glycosyltransferase family 4 protein [Pseudomonadota bacterium]|nr:glycosyltransferase family 4 protein [Pseudomonadota bacterium]
MIERVLVVHNGYQQRGGEDSVVESEIPLLRSRGHAVETYFRTNNDITDIPAISLARQTLWSTRTTHDLTELIGSFRPDIIHVHNTFPLISPSLYWVATRARVPVVQTLHNFRLICLNAVFLRDENVCEDCLGHLPWRGVAYACYRGSRAASATTAGMLALHRWLGTYRSQVTRYIALNEFCRKKFIQGGLPEDRIVVKPNFVNFESLPVVPRQGLLFVGRLSVEKGVATLARATALLPGVHLRVAGEGPDATLLDGLDVIRLGSVPGEVVRQQMNSAVALVVPSIWYENFPRSIVEAFACSLPVIASRIGALRDIVKDGETGLLFDPGNPRDLADKMMWALAHPEEMIVMGRKARACYESHYTAERNYEQLVAIYRDAIDDVKKSSA